MFPMASHVARVYLPLSPSIGLSLSSSPSLFPSNSPYLYLCIHALLFNVSAELLLCRCLPCPNSAAAASALSALCNTILGPHPCHSSHCIRFVTLLLHRVIFVALEMCLIGSSSGLASPCVVSLSFLPPSKLFVFKCVQVCVCELSVCVAPVEPVILIFTTWPSNLQQL